MRETLLTIIITELTVYVMIIALLGLTVYLSFDNKSNQLSFEEVNSKTTSGIQIITLLKLGLFGKDLRYEKVLSAMDILLLS